MFALPPHLSAKSDPDLIADDERHFAAIDANLRRTVAELTHDLAAARRAPGGTGQEALDRDLDVHRLSSRLRALSRFRLDLCLGRMVVAGHDEPVYVGRFGLTAADGSRLLVDWRSPAAEPFFAATHADPRGLTSRRRYRWADDRVVDYWDEVFSPDALEGHAALDDQSAFIASLGSSRSPRMRDVLATIQSDQDAIIRAGSRGALVVDGGPGTGKTVVALHRAAYLLYADPRLRDRHGHRRGGVLFVGPHQPYLAYVEDVLPSLGEEGVRTCTLRDLVPGGHDLPPEPDAEVARLKATAALVDAIEPAVALYEEPPTDRISISTPWSEVVVGPVEWREAFDAAGAGVPHDDARDHVWEALLDILVDKHGVEELEDPEDEDPAARITAAKVRRAIARDEALVDAFGGAWPLLDPVEVVGDLWEVPAYLRRCAPWLAPDEAARLRRTGPQRWTDADLPLLDAARLRVGDPEAARERRRQAASAAADRRHMDDVVDQLIAADDSDMMVMSMLRGDDLRSGLATEVDVRRADPDLLAGPFAHVVVDEAQELTDAEWRMLLQRCPTRSFTIVGDRAQARRGFPESWEERLARVGFTEVELRGLRVNYRTPAEVMAAAEPVIRAALPDANVPVSIRSSGIPVTRGQRSDLDAILAEWLGAHPEGTACVIGAPDLVPPPRVRSLSAELAKGLEFDLVVLVDTGTDTGTGTGVEAAVDRYVAMTRATQRLVVLSP